MKRYLFLLLCAYALCAAAADEVTIKWNEKGAKVKSAKGLTVTTDGGYVSIVNPNVEDELTFRLSGECHNGGLHYDGKYKVTFILDGLTLESQKGNTLDLSCGKRIKIKVHGGTENTLTDSPDTLHKAVIKTKGHLEFSGHGKLTINARGGHGIRAKEYVQMKSSLGTLDIISTGVGSKGIVTLTDYSQMGGDVTIHTSGDNEGIDDNPMMGPGGPMPGMPDSLRMGPGAMQPDSMMMMMMGPGGPMDMMGMMGGMLPRMDAFDMIDLMDEADFDVFSQMDAMFQQMDQMFGQMDDMMMGVMGGMDMVDGFQPDSAMMAFFDAMRGGMPDSLMMGGPGGPGPGKVNYKGTTKGLKAQGIINVDGGSLTVITETPGAEGIEGKQGVTLAGGNIHIDAYDDAINSNGKITFSGADVMAISRHNDAVDSNHWGDGGITISDGHVVVQSGAGPPEEGFDCDQWALVITGGEAFSIGSGMGPYPSMPTAQSATQPYMLFQNLMVNEGDTLTLTSAADGTELFSVKAQVTCPMNHSLVTSPRLVRGTTYRLFQNGTQVAERTL